MCLPRTYIYAYMYIYIAYAKRHVRIAIARRHVAGVVIYSIVQHNNGIYRPGYVRRDRTQNMHTHLAAGVCGGFCIHFD